MTQSICILAVIMILALVVYALWVGYHEAQKVARQLDSISHMDDYE